MKEIHNIVPFYDQDSKILILGSFPSVKSREEGFFYAHPQNQFWRLLADIFEEKLPNNIQEKKIFLTKHHIALWDVIKECEIKNSSDQSIKNVIPNDIEKIVKESQIKTIFTTGKTATKLYEKYILKKIKQTSYYLPSTSPLYASMSYEQKKEHYQIIKEKLEEKNGE